MQEPPSDEACQDVRQLVRSLGSWRASNREAALDAIRQMPPEQVEPLFHLLIPKQKVLMRTWKRHLRFILASYVLVLACFVPFIISKEGMHFVKYEGEHFYPIVLGVFFGGLLLSWLDYTLIERRVSPVLMALTAIQDVRAVGALLDSLGEGYLSDPLLFGALRQLLPRFQATDTEVLTGEQRRKLARTLERCLSTSATQAQDTAFGIAVLQAYAQIGDSRELPLVERLAKGRLGLNRGKLLQDAAQFCLSCIEARVAQEQFSTTLLRASSASLSGQDALLRPSQEIVETAPDQLLRASVAESKKAHNG